MYALNFLTIKFIVRKILAIKFIVRKILTIKFIVRFPTFATEENVSSHQLIFRSIIAVLTKPVSNGGHILTGKPEKGERPKMTFPSERGYSAGEFNCMHS